MPNLKDVAALAGVSLSTVSIIVNNKAEERKISKETTERVLRAIDELGYRPNIAAKKLKLGANEPVTVALFWTFDFRRGMITRFFAGLQEQLASAGFLRNIVIYPYVGGKLHEELASFTDGHFHAAIIANATPEDLRFLEQQNLSLPVVLYNRFSERFSSVNLDDNKIGELAAAHLTNKGYIRPLVIGSHSSFPGATKRRHAFVGTMLDKGIPMGTDELLYVENSVEGGYQFAKQNLAAFTEKGVDSFFCDSDAIALGMQSAFTADGAAIPKRFGIIAVGNGEPQYAQYSNPSLTVIDIPMQQMATACCRLLETALTRQSTWQKEELYFKTELIARGSTAR